MHKCGTGGAVAGSPQRVRSVGTVLAAVTIFTVVLVVAMPAAGSERVSGHMGAGWPAEAVADSSARLVLSIDFDPPNRVRRSDPAPYTPVEAYVVLEGVNPGNLPGGLRTVTLRLGVTGGMSSEPHFESLLPKKFVIGGWREGLVIASVPCSAENPVVIGVLHLFYLGKPGIVRVLDHPDFPRWVVDCEDEPHSFEIGSPGGIHCDPSAVAQEAPACGVGPGGEAYGSDGEGNDNGAGGDPTGG